MAGDRVAIVAGTTVSYDTISDAALNCVAISGRLNFATSTSTRLTVGTLMVMSDGHLWVGDSSTPISASALAEIVIANQTLNTQADPEQYGTGILGFGKVTIHGAAKAGFVRVSAEPRAGQSSLSLSSSPSGWRSGDRLVLPDTRHLRSNEVGSGFRPQWEEVNLGGASGSTATLTSGLAFDHLGARDQNGVLDFLPHVGNLTRNVVIRSATGAGTRGHVLFTARANIDVRYAAFRELGRTTVASLDSTTFDSTGGLVTHVGTNQIGRYPLHVHHLVGPVTTPANGHQFTLVGNVIDGATKWGIAIHNSHFGLIQGNVIYRADGAALMTEDGNESYNVIENNFALRGTGQGGRDAGGREGVGFYFRGPNNYVRNNVAANFLQPSGADTSYGYKYFLTYLGNIRIPTSPGADVSVTGQYSLRDGNATPILQFENNEVYGATESGLTYWWIGAFGQGFTRTTQRSAIKNFRVWHVHNKAIFNYESALITIDGLVVRGKDAPSAACCSTGIEAADYYADQWIIRNADIQGMLNGISPSTQAGSPQVIENSFLRNATNIALGSPFTSSNRADGIPPRRVFVKNVRFDPPSFSSVPYAAISMRFLATPTRNLIQADQLVVIDYDGNVGETFQVYYPEQSPSAIVPRTIQNSDGSPSLLASPVSGLTNTQTWATYRVAIAGAVAPCTTTRASIVGFTCPTSLTYTSPPPDPTAPPPPPPPTTAPPLPTPPPAAPPPGTWTLPAGALADYDFGTIANASIANRATAAGALPALTIRGTDVSASNGETVWNLSTSTTGFRFPFDPSRGTFAETTTSFPNTFTSGTYAIRMRLNPAQASALGQASSIGVVNFRPNPDVNIMSYPPRAFEFRREGPTDPIFAYVIEGRPTDGPTGVSTQDKVRSQQWQDGIQTTPTADHTYIVVWTPTTVTLYQDGILKATTTRVTVDYPTSAYRLIVGVEPSLIHSGDHQFFKGATRNLVVYNRALTGAEIAVLHGTLAGNGVSSPPNTTTPPPPTEVCGDEVDNDSDGWVDEGCPVVPPPPPPTTTPTTPTTPPPTANPAAAGDYDGDRRTDLTVFRPTTGTWYSLTSGSGFKAGVSAGWGTLGDVPVAGDYDGDGKMDLGIYRKGSWYIATSGSGFASKLGYILGLPGDIPVPADYDGDGKTDCAIFRPSKGLWFVLTSSSGWTGVISRGYGQPGDIPVPADYDGDRKADFAVYRPVGGYWYVLRSATNNTQSTVRRYGTFTDVPTPADYDGDGKADLAVYRPLEAGYRMLSSSSGLETTRRTGRAGERPVEPMDIDGDRKADFISYDPRYGRWYVLRDRGLQPGVLVATWGQPGDIPVAGPSGR